MYVDDSDNPSPHVSPQTFDQRFRKKLGGAPGTIFSILAAQELPVQLWGTLGQDPWAQDLRNLVEPFSKAIHVHPVMGAHTGRSLIRFVPGAKQSNLMVVPPPPWPDELYGKSFAQIRANDILYLDGYFLGTSPLKGFVNFSPTWGRSQGPVILVDLARPDIVKPLLESLGVLLENLDPSNLVISGTSQEWQVFDELFYPFADLRIPIFRIERSEPTYAEVRVGNPDGIWDFVTRSEGTLTPVYENTGLGDSFAAGILAGLFGQGVEKNLGTLTRDQWTAILSLGHDLGQRACCVAGGAEVALC